MFLLLYNWEQAPTASTSFLTGYSVLTAILTVAEDAADLSQFVDYWLGNEIADADYNQDGIVNDFEFAIFAGNWLQTIAY